MCIIILLQLQEECRSGACAVDSLAHDDLSSVVSASDTLGPSLSGMEDDTIAGSLAGAGPLSINTEAVQAGLLSVYHQYDFSTYSEAATKLPVFNSKKEVHQHLLFFQLK